MGRPLHLLLLLLPLPAGPGAPVHPARARQGSSLGKRGNASRRAAEVSKRNGFFFFSLVVSPTEAFTGTLAFFRTQGNESRRQHQVAMEKMWEQIHSVHREQEQGLKEKHKAEHLQQVPSLLHLSLTCIFCCRHVYVLLLAQALQQRVLDAHGGKEILRGQVVELSDQLKQQSAEVSPPPSYIFFRPHPPSSFPRLQ